MISLSEVQRIAGSLGVAPTVVDHDYVLGSFLHFLGQEEEVRAFWLFKGGTSLQKCHFGEYRFSEDLDFTATSAYTSTEIQSVAANAARKMQDNVGIRTDERAPFVDTFKDDYGKESSEIRIYYRGPFNYGSTPKSLQIHLSRDELVAFPPLQKRIVHLFSDVGTLPTTPIRTYSLEEILAEKLRAFSGQRRFAVSRDIFDIYYLLHRGAVLNNVIREFKAKCSAKEIDVDAIDLLKVENRKDAYELNWMKNLEYLVPEKLKIPFEEAWHESVSAVKKTLNR